MIHKQGVTKQTIFLSLSLSSAVSAVIFAISIDISIDGNTGTGDPHQRYAFTSLKTKPTHTIEEGERESMTIITRLPFIKKK